MLSSVALQVLVVPIGSVHNVKYVRSRKEVWWGFPLDTHTRTHAPDKRRKYYKRSLVTWSYFHLCCEQELCRQNHLERNAKYMCHMLSSYWDSVFLWPRIIFSWNVDCFFEERKMFGLSKVDGMFLQLYLYRNVIFLVRRGLNSGRGKTFSKMWRQNLGPTQLPVQSVLGLFPRGKTARAWCWPHPNLQRRR
jgi:hypothetical protein